MNRHLSRMIAMQTIYEWDFRENSDLEEINDRNIAEYENDSDDKFVNFLVYGIKDHLEEIDKIIVISAPEWPIDQVSLIDKSILRLAIFELLFSENVPPRVVINEAVELAKQFSGENSSKFVNGVLGTVYENHDLSNKTIVQDVIKKEPDGRIE